MKNSFTLFLLTISLLFSFNNVVFSQEKQSFLNGSLWIKGVESKQLNSAKLNPDKEEDLNKYFNFNPIVDFTKEGILKSYNTIIKKKSSLFVVFKSSSSEENNLLKIERGSFKASLSTKKLQSEKEIIFSKGDSNTGATVSYLFNKNSLKGNKDGRLVLDDVLYNDREHKNQLIELIYVPMFLNDREKNSIESFLALKYGISLNEGQNYYNSKNDTIWNAKKNSSYNSRVTGIGKDPLFGLNQKQSRNSLKDGFTIGCNAIEKTNIENKTVLLDNSFLIWGDNGGQCLLEKELNNNQKRMKRVWKIETTAPKSGVFSTQILIDKKLMAIENEQNIDKTDIIWLAIDTTKSSEFNYANAKYIKAAIDDNKKIIFNTIKFYTNTNYLLTIVKAPDFFATNDVEKPNCLIGQNGKINIEMIGGTAPYKIHIVSNNYNKEFLCPTEQINIENLAIGSYSLEIIDTNKKIQKSNFSIDTFNEDEISLTPNWYLTDDNPVKIIPKISENATDFTWLFEGNIVSTAKEFETKNSGNYLLKVGNKLGCKKEIPFSVIEKSGAYNEGYSIFPNPLIANDTFTIQFNLKTASNVSVKITDMSGKILKRREIGTIEKYEFKESLSVSGTYLIVVSINDVVNINKLIVK